MVTTEAKSYWQEKINGKRRYVTGHGWLIKNAKDVRLLEVYPLTTNTANLRAKLMAYLEGGKIFTTKFDNYEEAKDFVTRTVFDGANKDIHSK